MRLIHLNWSFVTGEGSVSYTKNFNEVHVVDQLDMLQDCIVDLTDKYNSLLAPNAAAPEASYGFPHGAVSAPKAGGSGLTAGETAPTPATCHHSQANNALIAKLEAYERQTGNSQGLGKP